jgi:phage replication-related protein YjqB (UPF0714/DUF867 family)
VERPWLLSLDYMFCRTTSVPDAKSYRGFADLAKHQARGKDYDILVSPRPASRVAVIAPHGGRIERGTSEIARAIAGDEFNLYLFEGIRPSKNYTALHLTSRLFDEPECLALIAQCPFVVAIHGCNGQDERVLLGGGDFTLKNQLAAALGDANVLVQANGHQFPATDPSNICNRGRTRRGAQLELTAPLRRSCGRARVVSAVRAVLVGLNAAA